MQVSLSPKLNNILWLKQKLLYYVYVKMNYVSNVTCEITQIIYNENHINLKNI